MRSLLSPDIVLDGDGLSESTTDLRLFVERRLSPFPPLPPFVNNPEICSFTSLACSNFSFRPGSPLSHLKPTMSLAKVRAVSREVLAASYIRGVSQAPPPMRSSGETPKSRILWFPTWVSRTLVSKVCAALLSSPACSAEANTFCQAYSTSFPSGSEPAGADRKLALRSASNACKAAFNAGTSSACLRSVHSSADTTGSTGANGAPRGESSIATFLCPLSSACSRALCST
mmetsp:Transcript_118436/g.334859  ORF Transcript_118436/g.334859 Transcript_118436/m.334859 type:complete len:230 (+) Transcript_118436:844-1533(+)